MKCQPAIPCVEELTRPHTSASPSGVLKGIVLSLVTVIFESLQKRSLPHFAVRRNEKWKQVRSWLARRCPAFPTVTVQQGKRVLSSPYRWLHSLVMLQSQPLRHCPCRQEG